MKKYSDYFKYLITFLILLPTNYLISHYVEQTSNKYVKHFKFFYNNNLPFFCFTNLSQ